MNNMKFKRELYSKVALLKAAYNYSDKAYIHLDADAEYYYVSYESKSKEDSIDIAEFTNEMLAQSVRHEIYEQTKDIRKLLMARALASSVVLNDDADIKTDHRINSEKSPFTANDILKDWFGNE